MKLNPPNITPRPWRFSTSPQPNGCPIIGSNGLMIAMLAHSVNEKGQKETALANAAFMTAAPAMAEALLDMLDAHKDDRDDAWCRGAHTAAINALLAAGYTIAPTDPT